MEPNTLEEKNINLTCVWHGIHFLLNYCKRFNYIEKALVTKTQAKIFIYVSNEEAFTAL